MPKRGVDRKGAARRPPDTGKPFLLILLLSVAGLAISLYLWAAKSGASELMCGPLGDCAAVNASAYAEIAGLPIAALGAAMYAGLAACAGALRLRPDRMRIAHVGFAAASAGAAFSLYLTALEAFVIRAYCMWCIASWILVTVIAVLWGKWMWRKGVGSRERGDHSVPE